MDFDVIFNRKHVLPLIPTAFLTERLDTCFRRDDKLNLAGV
ncbi:hypothetical protein [Candidatus Tisiphia endosymbiont of Hybos culiciformis]